MYVLGGEVPRVVEVKTHKKPDSDRSLEERHGSACIHLAIYLAHTRNECRMMSHEILRRTNLPLFPSPLYERDDAAIRQRRDVFKGCGAKAHMCAKDKGVASALAASRFNET